MKQAHYDNYDKRLKLCVFVLKTIPPDIARNNQGLTRVNLHVNSLSASLLLNIFLSFEVGIAHAIANFKWKENTSSLKNSTC